MSAFRSLNSRLILTYISGTLFRKSKTLDKHHAKMIKTSIYASKNLCYHLDARHKRTEDGYSKTTDTVEWGKKIKEFVGYRRDLLTRELSQHLRPPMYVCFPRIPHSPPTN